MLSGFACKAFLVSCTLLELSAISEGCSGWLQKSGPSALIWSERSSSALPARDASEGAQQLPEGSPPWASHGPAGSSWVFVTKMQIFNADPPQDPAQQCQQPASLAAATGQSLLHPRAHFGTVSSLLSCSDRHSPTSPGDMGTVGMVRALWGSRAGRAQGDNGTQLELSMRDQRLANPMQTRRARYLRSS